MFTILLIFCSLIWILIIFVNISQKGFLILLIWLCIAPIVTNILWGSTNPFFALPSTAKSSWTKKVTYEREGDSYKTGETNINLVDIIEPTRALFGAFFLVFLSKAILHKRPLFLLDKTEAWMGVFSFILVASALLQSTRVVFSLHVALDAFIVPFLGYYVTRRLVTSEDRFHQLTQALGYLGIYVIMACLIERLIAIEFLHRVAGPFADRDLLYMVLTTVFYAMLLDEKQYFPRIIRRFLIVLIPLVIFLTLTRGNWIGFFAGICVWLFLSRRLINPVKRLGLVGLMLILGMILGTSTLVFLPQEILTGRVANENTANWRLQRWLVAIQTAVEHPIVGIGLNNMRDALGKSKLGYSAVHQAFLSIFAEHGAVGLLIYIAIIKSILGMGLALYRRGERLQDRWRGITIIAVLVGYQIPGLFTHTFYYFHLGAVYIFVFAGGIAGLYSRPIAISNPYKFSTDRQCTSATPFPTHY
jgi:O-antigen ligase